MEFPADTRLDLIYNAHLWRWESSTGSSELHQGSAVKGWFRINENGRIFDLTYTDEDCPLISTCKNGYDAKGQLVIPGPHDAHIHVEGLGESAFFVNLSACRSIEDLQRTVKSHAEKCSDLPWIVGVLWDQTDLGRFPNRADIDAVCPDRPVFLWRACWHIGVANSAALRAASIDLDQTVFVVPGGEVEVDATGPTGILKERATERIVAAIGTKSFADKKRFIETGLDLCRRKGLTACQTNDEDSLEVYLQLEKENALPVRIFLTPVQRELHRCAQLAPRPSQLALPGSDVSSSSSRLAWQRVKIFSDGSLGAATAAVRDDSATGQMTGLLIYDFDQLKGMISESRARGFRVEVHAIGDAAAEQVLSAMEAAGVIAVERPVLTHCQVLGKDLIEKMRTLGVIANVQPSFVPTDMRWVQERLSVQKQMYAYAWKTLMKSDVVVAGGSDAPIESCSPFTGIYDAIERRSRSGTTGEQYRPEECFTFSEALWTYTIGAAFAAQCESNLGRIENGFAADFTVINNSVLMNFSLLKELKSELVCVGGRVTYCKGEPDEQEEIASAGITTSGDYIPGKNGARPIVPSTPGFGWSACKCCRQKY